MTPTATDVKAMLDDLDGGVFAEKIGRAISDVAAGVIEHGKQGEVTLKFSLKRIAESQQVMISHKLAFSAPTKRGKFGEENTTETPMHVNRGGRITLFPENQAQMFSRDAAPIIPQESDH